MAQFQRMLKTVDPAKSLGAEALTSLEALLRAVPAVTGTEAEYPRRPEEGYDFLVRVTIRDQVIALVCEVKVRPQPRIVRLAAAQLQRATARFGLAVPILIAPYLSPESQALCRDEGIGFVDLVGNARIAFDSIFIERRVPDRPAPERRQFRSIFKPKSAQVLRLLLRDPRRAWRVAELGDAAGVSLGHVSNVRHALVDREWAAIVDGGLTLVDPDAVLDAWRSAYESPAGERLGYYTVLHGTALDEAARQALRADEAGNVVFASFSAAHWLAPYARVGTRYFYADDAGLRSLCVALKLSPVDKGENVVITRLTDRGPLRDTIEPAPGVLCTSAAQTYLDLAAAGERGREAADHLRRACLKW